MIDGDRDGVDMSYGNVTLHQDSMIKNSDLDCGINTGHINTLRHIPKFFNLDLSNAPKNAKNGSVSVKKLNY